VVDAVTVADEQCAAVVGEQVTHDVRGRAGRRPAAYRDTASDVLGCDPYHAACSAFPTRGR
jgi:hypothetical protein